MRDHQLGFPAALLADTPAENTARYPLGRPKRDPEPLKWPFPLVKPEVTFVADSRTMDSDRPQPVVLGVDMGSPEGDRQCVVIRRGGNIAEVCFGVWRKTEPPANVKLKFRNPWTGEIKSRWPGPQSGWCEGWEWFDTSAEPEKPAQAEPQADAGWIEHTGDTPPQLKDDTMIFVRTRDGDERGPVRFGAYLHFAWMTSDNHPLDILSYRVVPA